MVIITAPCALPEFCKPVRIIPFWPELMVNPALLFVLNESPVNVMLPSVPVVAFMLAPVNVPLTAVMLPTTLMLPVPVILKLLRVKLPPNVGLVSALTLAIPGLGIVPQLVDVPLLVKYFPELPVTLGKVVLVLIFITWFTLS